jgi:hypothetical protein
MYLSPCRRAQLLRERGIDDALLAPCCDPAIGLRPTDSAPALGASRFGGLPDLPAGQEWPRGSQHPLTFLVQINCRETAALDAEHALPSQGMLYFFYDAIEQPWNLNPVGKRDAVVLYGPEESLYPASPPPDLDPEKGVTPVAGIAFERLVALDDYPEEALAQAGLSEAKIGAYYELYDDLDCGVIERDGSTTHWLLGSPEPIQGEMRSDCVRFHAAAYGVHTQAEEWRLLLQLDSDHRLGFLWGDCGRLYFWIRDTDLKLGHFAEVCTRLQCY